MVDPPRVVGLPVLCQEDVRGPPVRLDLLVVEHDGDVAGLLSRDIPPGAVVVPRGHEGVVVDPGVGSAPLDIPSGQDARVEVAIHEDGPLLGVPWAAQGAGALDLSRRRGVVGDELGRVDVDAVLVLKGRVGTLPGGDAAPAVSQ